MYIYRYIFNLVYEDILRLNGLLKFRLNHISHSEEMESYINNSCPKYASPNCYCRISTVNFILQIMKVFILPGF